MPSHTHAAIFLMDISILQKQKLYHDWYDQNITPIVGRILYV